MAEGTEVGVAYVSITPSAQGFGTKLEQLITGQAGQVGTKAGQALSTGVTAGASSIARNVTGILAGIGISGVLKGAVGEAEEAAKVGNLTAAVIKSTGGAAGVSAGQVEKLATSLSKIAGVDDEVIQSAENVMLTFRSVSGSVFPDAIKAALDMSAALGTDLQSSVIQLGKALNDPLQGMTALRRVGVSFTEDQQAQIKALQQSGDLLGAQKVILAELGSEFGGAAAAGATASGKLHVAVKNLEEDLGKALLPALDGAAKGLNVMLGGFEALPGPVQTVTSALLAVGAAATVFALIAPKLRQVREEMAATSIAGQTMSSALGWLGKIGAGIALTGIAVEGANALGGAVTRIATGAPPGLNALTKGLIDLGTSGQVTGEVAKQLGDHLQHLTDKASDFAAEGFLAKAGQGLAKILNPQLRDNLRDAKQIDEALAGLVSSGHADLAAKALNVFTDTIRNGPGGQELADKFTRHLTQYHDALDGVKVSALLAAQGIDTTTDAMAANADAADKYRAQLADMATTLQSFLASDWSKTLASNLTSALSPLQRFTVGFGGNVADLKSQVASAKDELAKAKDDLAKLAGSATTAEIARIRGQGGDIDAARAKVDEATAKLADSQKKLAEAEKTPLTQIRENLKANVDLLTGWLGDITKLSAGGHETLAKDLAALGPEAAGAVHEALGLSPKRLDELQGLFAKRDKLVGDAMSGQFELNVDQVGRPGETLANIIADRYKESITPKLTQATLDALNEASRIVNLDTDRRGGPGPAAAPPAAPPAGPIATTRTGPPITNPATGQVVFQTTVIAQTNADPHQIASTVGDNLAWRLRPLATVPG